MPDYKNRSHPPTILFYYHGLAEDGQQSVTLLKLANIQRIFLAFAEAVLMSTHTLYFEAK